MEYSSHAGSFRDLRVYRKAVEIDLRIFALSKSFPKEERYSLTDQVRRSSRSVGAQIAESWAKRRYLAHFVSKLTDADAEQMETQHWLETELRSNYVTLEEISPLIEELQNVGRMLNGMITKADSFCQPGPFVTKEETADYIVTPPPDGSRITDHGSLPP